MLLCCQIEVYGLPCVEEMFVDLSSVSSSVSFSRHCVGDDIPVITALKVLVTASLFHILAFVKNKMLPKMS